MLLSLALSLLAGALGGIAAQALLPAWRRFRCRPYRRIPASTVTSSSGFVGGDADVKFADDVRMGSPEADQLSVVGAEEEGGGR